ncbi:MAG TPA: PQQ-dependent sugar dehydrogenase [Candidatus Limnocylindrales bacterium]
MRSASQISRGLVLGAMTLLALAGCGPDGATTAAPLGSPTGSGPASTPPAASMPQAATPSLPAIGGGDRPDLASVHVAVEPAIGGLDAAIFVTGAGDGSGRLFVAQQGGVIRIVENRALLPAPFVDLSDRTTADGERGLLGVAFPPGFGPQRPEVFVHYSDRNGDTVVAAFTVDPANADRLDPSTERTILTQQQPYPNHNGGWIGFDQDGMLLIGLGDGGAGGDPENRASDLGTILGKLLRIDVLGAPHGVPYSVPADNPFVGRTGARGEILHYGLRNPFRDSVDLETGDLWIGDVGQDLWEEVDVARAGARGLDFGWRRWEGRHCYDRAAGCVSDGVTMPVTEYPHADGCSVIGGVVYRGDAIPALRGAYLFSDYCSGSVWALDADLDGSQPPIVLAETGRNVSSIGIDEDGEVWLTDVGGGALLRLVPAG